MAQIIKAPLAGVLEIFPRIFEDQRGYFFESYRADWLQSEGVDHGWVQDNQSYSQKGTVRGLHFQRGEFAQAKLVRVIQGKVLDVIVDLRYGSPTFGEIYSTVLDATRNNLMYVPTGFAHGFSVLEDSIFAYKCSNYYNKESEGGIIWNDPALDIDWQIAEPITSEKDATWPTLEEFKTSERGL
ncbi:dTDP-4-dehydrorhamnose 3,5-epimerase [Algoriphagus antarcticus]|uniref:dTDP-4-dehydrorhamnose 3,5-epimerase n=1 Tax=Algoriphagus antarcticus TaxID=238540 RepID=A0A3E0DM89_9BACT|nr:dTDP-4-dehydrorhamnose 3,5-epimerase [Algoriphagus antarcticus]REG83963.1 dTDP-4-dehydrorhamnose 3,5-epimerase [Algoriphagus antarcticus]